MGLERKLVFYNTQCFDKTLEPLFLIVVIQYLDNAYLLYMQIYKMILLSLLFHKIGKNSPWACPISQ